MTIIIRKIGGLAEVEVFLTHLAVQGTIALLTPRFHTEHLGVNPAAPSTEAGVALHFIYYEGLFDVFNEELEHLGESCPARD
jgi:hypothetical protein